MDILIPAFIGIPGGPELLIVLLLVILLFGADKLPKLARSSGQAMGEFKQGREQIEDELTQAAEATPAQADTEPSERE